MSDQEMSESVEAPLDTELASPRLQFYLRHKANIETWAALKNDVREATGDLLAGIQEDLQAFASDYGNDVVVRYDAEGTRFPRLLLRRRSWPEHEQEATVGVGLEWVSKVDPSGKEPPYYGIRVARTAPGGGELMGALRVAVKAAGVFPKPYVFTGRDWPVYRYMDADPDWWQDLAAWRQRVIDEVVACWQVSLPIVDDVMSGAARR